MPDTTNPPPSLEIDFTCYEAYFEDDSISDADKQALLQALWSIICSFVRIGWNVHPLQQAETAKALQKIACGQVKSGDGNGAERPGGMVKCQDGKLEKSFESAANRSPQKAGQT